MCCRRQGSFRRCVLAARRFHYILGYVIIALAVPVTLALVAFWRATAALLQLVDPAVYQAFVALMVVVEYIWSVEFQSPMRYDVLVPFLLLFFGLATYHFEH